MGRVGVGALDGWRVRHASGGDGAAHCRSSQAGCGLPPSSLGLPSALSNILTCSLEVLVQLSMVSRAYLVPRATVAGGTDAL